MSLALSILMKLTISSSGDRTQQAANNVLYGVQPDVSRDDSCDAKISPPEPTRTLHGCAHRRSLSYNIIDMTAPSSHVVGSTLHSRSIAKLAP
ncbi:hypothetical protein PHSY_000507 [Pseudozyma hubeiensis SY62]|uniref:Uncharacterized protein n=1 Tax=Pseudozyma hubeiensis (strain SY62) TaxID=1305764 RepID=R9NWT3_PSEHS|nr:hypothetical protein PHSY_000507 [Pseudozyma hubeiensis SY62]GAC92947.1 hypothetical protein PHSY_000507 [Pseudozyma hubeiensis SY62]